MEILGLPAAWIAQGGAVALLMAVSWLVFTGRLVPRSAVEDLRADRDYWREALRVCQETNGEKLDQHTVVVGELTRTVDQFFESLPIPARDQRRQGRNPR